MKHTGIVRAERNMAISDQRMSFTCADTVGMRLKAEICLYTVYLRLLWVS